MCNKNENHRKGAPIILALDVTANESNRHVIIIRIIIAITDNKHVPAANSMPGSTQERIKISPYSAGLQQIIIAIENNINSNSIFY